MDNVINLGRLWLIVRRNWTSMLAFGVIAGGVAFGVSKFVIHPQYSSSAALLVNRKEDATQQGIQLGDQQADIQIINTYKDIITRPIILKAVVQDLTKAQKVQVEPAQPAKYKLKPAKYANENLSSNKLANMISISSQNNSQVFTVDVKSNDAKMSADIANSIAEVFKTKITNIMSVSNVSIVSKAIENKKPVDPNVKLITLAGLMAGVLAGFSWGFVKEISDRTVKNVEFLTNDLGLTNLGVINYIERIRDLKDVVAENNKSNKSGESRIERFSQRI